MGVQVARVVRGGSGLIVDIDCVEILELTLKYNCANVHR